MMGALILVVEDERLIANDIRRTLCGLGYTVPKPVASALEAVRQAEALRPDLVLLDIKLKGSLDGIEAGRTIRERFRIPIVYLTSYSDDATFARAMETRPHGYLLKPFHDRELHQAIERALQSPRLESSVS